MKLAFSFSWCKPRISFQQTLTSVWESLPISHSQQSKDFLTITLHGVLVKARFIVAYSTCWTRLIWDTRDQGKARNENLTLTHEMIFSGSCICGSRNYKLQLHLQRRLQVHKNTLSEISMKELLISMIQSLSPWRLIQSRTRIQKKTK